ncbi:MAG: DUF2723 domain-containing protein [Fibrobacteres bacterium]|nr:DUF2723 domain-containing protein [Fibrobacterota bacterium]
MTERKLKWFGALGATLFALVVYTLTMSPSVSFWDCGEYISAGNMLAVPHPPGMPLHHLIARVGILMFTWWDDIGARVNWISCLASALIAGTAYLTAFRGIRMLQSRKEQETGVWVAVLGGVLAGLMSTFCDTLWFSSVEAEMYTPAMFFTLLSVYLMLEWTDLRSTPWGDRLLVFVIYMSYLGVNFTMFTVMFVPILVIYVVFVDESKRRMYPLYIAGTLLLSVIYMPGLFPLLALFCAVVSFFAVLVLGRNNTLHRQGWKLSSIISLAALLGWSMYLYIPIRSSLDPIVDEGDPEVRKPLVLADRNSWDNLKNKPSLADAFDLNNWGEFREYIERKQYGSENMIVRSMTRRSNPLNQFLVHENMGYGGYLVQQFTPFKNQRVTELFGIKIPSLVSSIGVNSIREETSGKYVQDSGRRLALFQGWKIWQVFVLMLVTGFLLAQYVARPFWRDWTENRNLWSLLAGVFISISWGIFMMVAFGHHYSGIASWIPYRWLQLSVVLLAHLPLLWLFRLGWSRQKQLSVLLAGLYVFSSFGMLWYVNFSDGTRPEVAYLRHWEQQAKEAKREGVEPPPFPGPVHMEVRERDYFFTPAFVLVAVLYGMAAALYAQRLRDQSKRWQSQPKFVGYMAMVAMMPVVAGASNWHQNDRHLNWIPYDYAYNLLNSCDPNGILFTNGDNDTFPLWALQYAYGIRPDVRLVNLSLINTDWYIRQMRDIEPKVPVSFSDVKIKDISERGGQENPYPANSEIPIGKRMISVPSREQKPWLATQDIMVINIAMANEKSAKRKPIHFAATVGEDNMMGLAPYCRMQGMVYTLTDSMQQDPVDIDRTLELFSKVYRFRGMAGDEFSKGFLDDDSRRLESNYSSIAIQAAMLSADAAKRWDMEAGSSKDTARVLELRRRIDDRVGKILTLIRASERLMPKEWRTPYSGAILFGSLGKFASADSLLDAARKRMPEEVMIERAAAEVASRANDVDKSIKVLLAATKRFPNDYQLEADLGSLYASKGDFKEGLAHLDRAVKINPGDERLVNARAQFEAQVNRMQQMMPPAVPTVPQLPQLPVPAPPEPKDTQKADTGKK